MNLTAKRTKKNLKRKAKRAHRKLVGAFHYNEEYLIRTLQNAFVGRTIADAALICPPVYKIKEVIKDGVPVVDDTKAIGFYFLKVETEKGVISVFRGKEKYGN